MAQLQVAGRKLQVARCQLPIAPRAMATGNYAPKEMAL